MRSITKMQNGCPEGWRNAKRLLRIIRAVLEQSSTKRERPCMLSLKVLCCQHSEVQMHLLGDLPSGHVACGSSSTCWNATRVTAAESRSTSQSRTSESDSPVAGSSPAR